MHVRKFQGESIEETIKVIKKELGPEAIILKTETFRGIKSALKNSKIEITAAITEKNLKKKMSVDRVLNDEQKDQAYNADSESLLDMIDGYDRNNANYNKSSSGYGGISLNKNVVKKEEDQGPVVNELVSKSSLDTFLSNDQKMDKSQNKTFNENETTTSRNNEAERNILLEKKKEFEQSIEVKAEILNEIETRLKNTVTSDELKFLIKKTENLENTLSQLNLSKNLSNDDIQGVTSILSRSGVSDEFINKELLLGFMSEKKKSEDVNKNDFVKFCIDRFRKTIKTDKINIKSNTPKAFVYISTPGSGQSSLIRKIIKDQGSGEVVSFLDEKIDSKASVLDEMLSINHTEYSDPAKLFAAVRKCLGSGVSVHIDLRLTEKNTNNIFHLLNLLDSSIQGIRKSLTLSCRFGFKYNSRIVQKCRGITDNFNLTFFDECYDFGAIFNLFYNHADLKLSYISDGEEIPLDLMKAESEILIEKILNI